MPSTSCAEAGPRSGLRAVPDQADGHDLVAGPYAEQWIRVLSQIPELRDEQVTGVVSPMTPAPRLASRGPGLTVGRRGPRSSPLQIGGTSLCR